MMAAQQTLNTEAHRFLDKFVMGGQYNSIEVELALALLAVTHPSELCASMVYTHLRAHL